MRGMPSATSRASSGRPIIGVATRWPSEAGTHVQTFVDGPRPILPPSPLQTLFRSSVQKIFSLGPRLNKIIPDSRKHRKALQNMCGLGKKADQV